MPTPDNTVSLLIGGKVHSQWSSYDLDSNLETIADAWHVTLGLPRGEVPAIVDIGATIQVRVGADTVMTGYIDEIEESIDKGGHTLMLSGRDLGGVLVDCSAPLLNRKQITLAELMADVVRPLGIDKIQFDPKYARRLEKVDVEPGSTAWDLLKKLVEANGLWAWFQPDGTLVIDGPDYSQPPVASLVMRRAGRGNNLVSLKRRRNMTGLYSKITVLGQSQGNALNAGKHAIKGVATNPELKLQRELIRPRNDVENDVLAGLAARKLMADARRGSFALTAVVSGHRTSDGVLWEPGQRIHVLCEPHDIDGEYFLMSRKFQGGREQQATTTLTLVEDGVWVVDADPGKWTRRARRDSKK
ncbi:phage baseplate assembly protein [Microvirgula aerodenitrificans]|uniref:phage baseplate assembly protein n=1 Tax=Microvirgula aerodenitrificans TaxID=57480 RepID=UPI00248DE4C5|nr:phage tail protein [Microvirgula aerodenitrificans]